MIIFVGSVVGLLIGLAAFFLSSSIYAQDDYGQRLIAISQIVKLVGTAGFFTATGAILSSMIVITREKTANMIELLGKYHSTKKAGFGIKPPAPLGRVVGDVNLQLQQLPVDVTVKSQDNAFLNVPVRVQYRVIEGSAHLAFYELRDAVKQMSAYIVNVVRAKANTMKMDDIFKSKDEFKTDVEQDLKDKFEKFGYKIEDVLVDDPQPSDELKKAFDKVLAAQRDQEASLLEKQAIFNRLVGKAEAEGRSLDVKADAYVLVRGKMATGNSAAIKEFCKDLNITHSEALAYFAGIDTRDAIRDASEGKGSVVVIPVSGLDNGIGNTTAMLKALSHNGNGSEDSKKIKE